MRTPKNIPNELKRLINAIVKRSGDCENWLKGYNRATWTYTWFGSPMTLRAAILLLRPHRLQHQL